MTAEKFGEKYLGWIILAVIAFFVVRNYWGDKVPGAFFERGEDYEQSVYVNVYPDGDKAKNYHLKGDIMKSEGSYSLSRIYWPNGGYSDFNSCDGVNLKAKEYCIAEAAEGKDEGDTYDIQLTNELAD